MRTIRVPSVSAFLAALAAGLLAAPGLCAASPADDRRVDIGSHRLQMNLEGSGKPTVVIDSGIADRMDKLRPLQERLARETSVIIYNRAGYGESEPGPLPRDAGREADEIEALLEKASVPGPYVLVGHSLGALNVQVFASRYPDRVAGMVLLDPPPLSFILGRDYRALGEMAEKMTAEWQAVADSSADSAAPEERATSAFFRMIASEHREMFGTTAKLVAGVMTFGDTPLIVIASGKSNPAFGAAAEGYQKYWIEQSRLLSGKSLGGRFIVAGESTHALYVDAPDLVARSILSVVRAVRAKGGRRSAGTARRESGGDGACQANVTLKRQVWPPRLIASRSSTRTGVPR